MFIDNTLKEQFLDILSSYKLEHLINEPSRYCSTNSSLLDCILTTLSKLIVNFLKNKLLLLKVSKYVVLASLGFWV